jgi:hypothetical protein
MDRLKIAQIIALGATLLIALGGVGLSASIGGALGETILSMGILASFVSYCFGGLLTALKIAGRIAKYGWFIVPFPYDIITFVFTFFVGIIVLFCLPIIPIRVAYNESRF